LPEIYTSDDITALLKNGNTSGVYRYFSYAMQNDFTRTKTYDGISYLNYLESLGWEIYFQSNAFYACKEFTTAGTQTTTITPFEKNTFNVLCVAGGGGGGGQHGGAGGAGGYQLTTKVFNKSSISITVGEGGTGAQSSQPNNRGTNGANSVIDDIVSIGGGGGGTYQNSGSGAPGGSGGGGAIGHTSANGNNFSWQSNSQVSTPGYAISTQGNPGGSGWHVGPGYPGGGGGGAGSSGVGRLENNSGGAGGNGLSNTILGYTRWFAGGGGGWSHGYFSGTGGIGGGGLGLMHSSFISDHANAAPNSGGGGGGGGHSNGIRGGNGGSGIVVIRTQIVYSAGGIG
jgi:hypothetical protein